MKIGLIYFGGQYNHLILKNVKYLGETLKPLIPPYPWRRLRSMIVSSSVGSPIREGGATQDGKFTPVRQRGKRSEAGYLPGAPTHSSRTGWRGRQGKYPEFGLVRIKVEDHDTILSGVPSEFNAWESHNDEVKTPPPGFRVLASSETTRIQSMVNSDNSIFTVQFHPEVKHTEHGIQVLKNFLEVCKGR